MWALIQGLAMIIAAAIVAYFCVPLLLYLCTRAVLQAHYHLLEERKTNGKTN